MPAAWVEAGVAVYGALESSQGGGSGGNYSSGTQQNMQAADPFASQRFQYQQALARLMGVSPAPATSSAGPVYSSPSQGIPNPSGFGTGFGAAIGGGVYDQSLAGSSSNHIAANGTGSGSGYIYNPGLGAPSTGSGGAAGGLSTAQGAAGPAFVPSDPSYNFRLQSGSEAIQRAMGAKGMNGSGNMMAALMQYGQNLGSTEYQNEFNRLAILSGAESGSPAAAGQLGQQGQQMQQNTDAATLAQWNQWLQPAAKAVGGWLGGGSSGSSGGSSGDPFAAD